MKVSFRVPLVAAAAILPFLLSVGLAQSDAPKNNAKAAGQPDAKPAKARAKPRGRLPAYYSKVIDGQQREKIYAIQQQYEPKIAALKAELQSLQDKSAAEIDAVLTAPQREMLKKLADEAKQKRKAASATSATASAAASGGAEATAGNGKPAADGKAAASSAKTTATGGK